MISCNCVVLDYRKFMKNSANKASLALFICPYLVETILDVLAEITLAGGFIDGLRVVSIKGQDVIEVPQLFSSHEEADTRMLLHAVQMSQHHKRVIINADDTDILFTSVMAPCLNMCTVYAYRQA